MTNTIANEARAYLERVRTADGPEPLADLIWEASGLLRTGRGKIYVPTKFLKGPLAERSVKVAEENLSEVNLRLEWAAFENWLGEEVAFFFRERRNGEAQKVSLSTFLVERWATCKGETKMLLRKRDEAIERFLRAWLPT